MNTKKPTFLLISFLFISVITFAKEVNPKIVSLVAVNAYSQCSGKLKSDSDIAETIIIKEKDLPVFSIFNFKEEGFIIVSNDDAAIPVLGYGFYSNFEWSKAPDGLKYLLNEYKKEILSVRNEHEVSTQIKNEWDKFSLDVSSLSLKSYTVGNNLLMTLWNQDEGFQVLCPEDPITHITSKVGCGGVALAQILYYWGCRVFPDNSVSYLPENFQNSITLNFYSQTYDWNSMDMDSPDNENKKLLFHSAVSLESDFSSDGTSHDINGVPYSLRNYWGFNSGNVIWQSANSSSWNSLLRDEIDNERPVYYGGAPCDTCVGHVWVVDGYRTSDNKYHCNWGWGDDYIGWFTLDDLTPGNENYNSSQFAVMGIYPELDACTDLSGASTICSSNASYSVSIPSSASIAWSNSYNLNQVGGSTGENYTVNSAWTDVSGTGWVTATIKNSQGNTFMTRTKYVGVNGPKSEDLDLALYTSGGTPVSYMCPGRHYHIYLNNTGGCSLSDYDWSIPSGWTKNYTYNNMISVYSGSTYGGMVEVYATTCCAEDVKVIIDYFGGGYCGSSYALVFSPNPTIGETLVTIKQAKEDEVLQKSSLSEPEFDKNAEWDLAVYDNFNNIKLKKEKLKGNSVLLQIADWQEGIYFVRVNYKNEMITSKLVVKK